MKKAFAIFFSIFMITAVLPAAFASEDVLDEIIIGFYPRSNFEGMENQYDDEVAEFLKDVLFMVTENVYVIKAEDLSNNPDAVLNRYKNSNYIEYVEPNYLVKADYVPNDPHYKSQSEILGLINAEEGWNISKGENSPIIAIIDTGVSQHPDLPMLLNGYSAVSGLAPGNDMLNHGTGVAGVIGAVGNNGIGIAGINWNAKILPVKVDDASGIISAANVAKGIIWSVDNGANVINLSLCTKANSITLKKAIDYAYYKGCALFAATGNEGASCISYPARYINVMAVGSSSDGKSRESISNYGLCIDIVALNSFYTTTASGKYTRLSGTSFSTPQASALAAMVWSINPDLTNNGVYSLLQQGAKPLGGGFNDHTGYGLIDIGKTLELALSSRSMGQNSDEKPAKYTTPPVITLNGFMEIRLDVDNEYIETGYKAVDCFNTDLTDAVIVTNNVNTKVPGIYTINYAVEDLGGNAARATRTVIIRERDAPTLSDGTPTLTVIGFNPIILYLGGIPYTEQGANAFDDLDGDISNKVHIIGYPDESKAGTYTITYNVTNSAGQEASAVRDVRILDPAEEKLTRMPYNFTGQGKALTTNRHTGIVCDTAGYMDFEISSISSKSTISVSVIDERTGTSVFSDIFNSVGSTQFWTEEGAYRVEVSIIDGIGSCFYGVNLLSPEVINKLFKEDDTLLGHPNYSDNTFNVEDEDVPLGDLSRMNGATAPIMILPGVGILLISGILWISVYRKIKFIK